MTYSMLSTIYINSGTLDCSAYINSDTCTAINPKFKVGDKVKLIKGAEYEVPYPIFLINKILIVNSIGLEGESIVYGFKDYDHRIYVYEEHLEKVRTCKLNRRQNNGKL